MRTETIKIYEFSELPEAGQQKAIDRFREHHEFGWSGEWQDTLKYFLESFPFVKVPDWEISVCSPSFARVQIEVYDGVEDLSGVRLWKWLINSGHDFVKRAPTPETDRGYAKIYGASDGSCPMTGYCGDCDILEPLEKFLLRPDKHATLFSLFQACLDSWVKAYLGDLEHAHSDEGIRETIECNEYEFTEDGTLQ